MTDPLKEKGIGPEPIVASWELWSVATMLRSVHGDEAESVAAARLADAEDREHEGDIIVWRGVLTRLREPR